MELEDIVGVPGLVLGRKVEVGSCIGAAPVDDKFKLVTQFYVDCHLKEVLVGLTFLAFNFLPPGSLL